MQTSNHIPWPIMRRILSNIAFLVLLLVTNFAYGQETYLDNFNTVSYSNNNGTMNFSSAWVETGETTDPTAGRILINSNQLRFQNMDTRTIERSLDLSSAISATLTMSYNRTSGNESIAVQLWDGSQWNTRATLSGSGTVNYNLTAAERSNSSAIRFISASGGWGSSETIFVDDVQFSAVLQPTIIIDDISVNENAGTVTFTATHVGLSVFFPFTVDFQTNDGTAVAGSDYSSNSGTLNFTGFVGDTETITVSITDDSFYESDETFTISMSNSSNPLVIISDTGDGTIVDDEVVLGNTPLTLYREFDGYMDYTSTGGTLRTQPNTGDWCAITNTSSGTLSTPIPATATINAAYLYWSHSGATMDTQVTFEGQTINAELVYQTILTNRTFHGSWADVTTLVQGTPSPSTNVWDFSGLTIDTSANYCNTATVLGGWSLIVFYTDLSLPASTINLYQGFDGNSNSSSSFTLSGFFAIGSVGSKTTSLSWEGDQTLANSESLQFTTPSTGTNLLQGDGDNVGATNNPFNSTNYDGTAAPVRNITTTHGVDLDTYDVSPFIGVGETTATTTINVGQDFVIMNAVLLKVPSNLVTGTVFEDVNYGGGAGRNLATSGGVGIQNVTVELYDNLGVLQTTTTTNASGQYVFAGMANGTYSVRVVNNTVRSTRPGGSACTTCIPVQTFKSDYIGGGTIVETTTQVGGANSAGADPAIGILAGAQTIGSVTINNEGAAGLDFGFNFNTIVNTNVSGQGSLEQFIINSNEIGETGLDIEANAIFDPAAGEDTSVFMIPPTGDALGRAADVNYLGGVFDIKLVGVQLTDITGDNTHIDGRTQTAYSGDSNTGTVGGGGTAVGISGTSLPNFDRPEIQVYNENDEVFINQGTSNVIRNLAIYSNNAAGILMSAGSLAITDNLIGVDATGANGGAISLGVEVNDGSTVIQNNYITTTTVAGILVDGGNSTLIQNNHITLNGATDCDDNIQLISGTGITIQQNLIDYATGMGIEGDGFSGGVTIHDNTIAYSGTGAGTCSGDLEKVGIRLHGDNSTISQNVIHNNGGAGLVLAGGSTTGNLITQNSFYTNGTAADALGIDLDENDGVGDGPSINDSGDGDSGPNGLLNFPIIQTAFVSGTDLVIKGWSRPGATLEFFMTDINEGTASTGDNQVGLTQDYGEGQIYIGTVVEGSVGDSDGTTSSYTDADGNTDNTNRFQVSVPLPPGVVIGDLITATATLSNTTSEFSPQSVIKVATIITNRRITYRVNKN